MYEAPKSPSKTPSRPMQKQKECRDVLKCRNASSLRGPPRLRTRRLKPLPLRTRLRPPRLGRHIPPPLKTRRPAPPRTRRPPPNTLHTLLPRLLTYPKLRLLPDPRLQRNLAPLVALAYTRPPLGLDKRVVAPEADAVRVAQLLREAVVGARVVGGVAREVGAGVGGVLGGEEVLVDLAGEGEVGGDLAEVEFYV